MQKLPPHPNVLALHGIVTDATGPLCLVMEFCGGGSMDVYLTKRTISLLEKVCTCCLVFNFVACVDRHYVGFSRRCAAFT